MPRTVQTTVYKYDELNETDLAGQLELLETTREQRDELLAALKLARPHIGVGYSAYQRHSITSAVDAAIAKVQP